MSVFVRAWSLIWGQLSRSRLSRGPSRFGRADVFQSQRWLAGVIAVCLIVVSTSAVSADGIEFFDRVAGSATGEFGWDNFNGASYVGPHTPDEFSTGIGLANMVVNEGGFGPTSQGNLYSFMSTPVWNVNLTGLEANNFYTSLAVQFAVTESATPGNLTIDSFTLGMETPSDFFLMDKQVLIGGQTGALDTPVEYYWVEWNGLTAATDYTLSVTGTGFHQSLVATKVSYVNTSSDSYNIENVSSVPEPSSAALGMSLFGLLAFRRRRSPVILMERKLQ